MAVRFTTTAKGHIRAIRRYSLHRWGKDVAEAYADTLRVTMTDILDRHPSPGRNRRDDLQLDVMSFPVESHIIYYRETATGIEILAVLHQTQDPYNHLHL